VKFIVVTLFPELVESALGHSILKQARAAGSLQWQTIDIRQHCEGRHKQADDAPFGGGGGMVMKAAPVISAVAEAKGAAPGAKVIYLSPQGRPFDQAKAAELARSESLILLCGHYEGLDERALQACVDEELSLGDFVLTGGELAACVVIDAVSRLKPGVLGNEASAGQDSFSNGLLEHPHYTRPAEGPEGQVPAVLLSGDHAAIERWRRQESLRNTFKKRPGLLSSAALDKNDRAFLNGLGWKEETS